MRYLAYDVDGDIGLFDHQEEDYVLCWQVGNGVSPAEAGGLDYYVDSPAEGSALPESFME